MHVFSCSIAMWQAWTIDEALIILINWLLINIIGSSFYNSESLIGWIYRWFMGDGLNVKPRLIQLSHSEDGAIIGMLFLDVCWKANGDIYGKMVSNVKRERKRTCSAAGHRIFGAGKYFIQIAVEIFHEVWPGFGGIGYLLLVYVQTVSVIISVFPTLPSTLVGGTLAVDAFTMCLSRFLLRCFNSSRGDVNEILRSIWHPSEIHLTSKSHDIVWTPDVCPFIPGIGWTSTSAEITSLFRLECAGGSYWIMVDAGELEIWRWGCPESHGGTHSHHPFLDGSVPNKNQPAVGVPSWVQETPIWSLVWSSFFCCGSFLRDVFFLMKLRCVQMFGDVWRCSRGETLVDKFEDSKMGTDGRKGEDFRPLNLGNTFYW